MGDNDNTTPSKTRLTVVLKAGRFSICRFAPECTPPSWVFENKQFYSVTKTDEELSVVCHEESIPCNLGEKNGTVLVDSGWCLFKVLGPLDFGLTGVLNSLTNPLAKACVSLFAVSTYDTDYILVKHDRVLEAGHAWIAAGHVVEHLPDERRPKDGPAVVFERDPMLERLHLLLQHDAPQTKETFGLVVVAGWSPSDVLKLQYEQNFLPAVRACFDDPDLMSHDNKLSNAYLYSGGVLHVTVATLHSFFLQSTNDESTSSSQNDPTSPTHQKSDHRAPSRSVLTREWTALVQAASRRKGWPRKPLQLVIDTAQIGTRAGILLWRDLSGGIDEMRQCIQAEVEQKTEHLEQFGIDSGTLSIPTILHSTFVRFNQIPDTPGNILQDRFQHHVLAKLRSFFPDVAVVPDAKLVCERRPYMHIDKSDPRHVVATFPLGVVHQK